MIEREQQRAYADCLEADLEAYLKKKHFELIDHIVSTALERGYAPHVPDLREAIESLVRELSEAMVRCRASEPRTLVHWGEHLDGDPLVQFVRQEFCARESLGVPRVVLFGLLHLCRDAYSSVFAGHESAAQEGGSGGIDADLLASCFDRIELGLVAAWQMEHRAYERAGQSAVRECERRGDDDSELRTNERCRELLLANERLRRELDQRMRIDEERELYYRAMLHRQKLEAVGALAGGIAHDLNNLFQVVRCNVDLLRERADKSNFALLEEVAQVMERAVGLVRQLLLFSRKQPMARRILDVGEVVRDLLRLLRRVMPENVRLYSEVEDKLPLVRADVSAIEQLVMNLVINARDSMPRGGTIHVSVCRQRRVPPERIRASSSLHQIAIIVRDVGVGMPQDVLARIFDPFFTTKSHSSGLGLSVVHGVVEEHGGWVEVTSAIGQGSCFAIYLPVLDDAQQGEPVEIADEQRHAARGERLLLVEDEDAVRRALGRELARFGYSVQSVGSAEEALNLYRRAPGYFDCIISDGLMPGMSGPEMVLEMLKDNPDQRAIFISGYAPTLDCWSELKNRGFRLLAKPFGTNELVAALRETLEPAQDTAAVTLRASRESSREPRP